MLTLLVVQSQGSWKGYTEEEEGPARSVAILSWWMELCANISAELKGGQKKKR